MGPRTGTPMRLVSPAPVMVPPNGSRGPPQAPQIYPPQQTQQSLYSTQNGSGVGGGMYHRYIYIVIHILPCQHNTITLSSSFRTSKRTNAPASCGCVSNSLPFSLHRHSTLVLWMYIYNIDIGGGDGGGGRHTTQRGCVWERSVCACRTLD